MVPQHASFMRLTIAYLLASYVPVVFWVSWLVVTRDVEFSLLPLVLGPVVLPASWLRGQSLIAVPLAVLAVYLLLLPGLAWWLRRHERMGFAMASVLFMLSLAQGLWFVVHYD